ncbi:MAG TPA: hypothetical protein VNE62_05250 [Actinomycetota bacterium]|nr:hypothetical protein [Actinomycetota bacterium]
MQRLPWVDRCVVCERTCPYCGRPLEQDTEEPYPEGPGPGGVSCAHCTYDFTAPHADGDCELVRVDAASPHFHHVLPRYVVTWIGDKPSVRPLERPSRTPPDLLVLDAELPPDTLPGHRVVLKRVEFAEHEFTLSYDLRPSIAEEPSLYLFAHDELGHRYPTNSCQWSLEPGEASPCEVEYGAPFAGRRLTLLAQRCESERVAVEHWVRFEVQRPPSGG